MGLYDNIKIPKKFLPPEVAEIEGLPCNFQTKDFENALLDYFINDDGFLKLDKVVETKWIEDSSSFFKGYREIVKRETVDVAFFGEIDCCDCAHSKDESGVDYFVDLRLRFDNDQLVSCAPLNIEKTPAKKRFDARREFAAKMKLARSPQNRLKRFIGKIFWKMSLTLQRWHVSLFK
jgi:hypothetical protein